MSIGIAAFWRLILTRKLKKIYILELEQICQGIAIMKDKKLIEVEPRSIKEVLILYDDDCNRDRVDYASFF